MPAVTCSATLTVSGPGDFGYRDPLRADCPSRAAIARWDARRIGPRSPSKLLAKLSFGTFNLRFLPARTAFDWLSRDTAQVDRYLNDPLCGFDCSAQLWVDLFGGIIEIETLEKRSAHLLPKGLPVLRRGWQPRSDQHGRAGVRQLLKHYRRGGLGDVSFTLYDKAATS